MSKQPQQRSRFRRSAVNAIKICLAVGLLVYLIRSGLLEPKRLLGAAEHWPILLAALLLSEIRQFLFLLRWRVLLDVQEIRTPLWHMIKVYWTSLFLGLMAPGGIGMDTIRSYFVVRDYKGARTKAFSTIVFDRAIGLVGLLCLGVVMGLVLFRLVMQSRFLLIIWLMTVGVFFTALFGMLILNLKATGKLLDRAKRLPLQGRIRRFREAVVMNIRRPSTLAVTLLLSIIGNIIGIEVLVLCSQALDFHPELLKALFAVPIAFLINSMPITPGGIGVGEGAVQAVYQALGYQTGAESMLIMRVVLIASGLPGLFFFLRGKLTLSQIKESDQSP